MLILTRKQGEAILVDGPAKFIILSASATVRIGIEALPETTIVREEVQRRMAAGEPLHTIEDDLDCRENQARSRK